MAFTEFYMQNGGSNLNAGSTTNNTALYTSTGGDWVSGTRVFTPTDGVNPVSAGVAVGMFASVYVTSGATATAFIGRVSAVANATNGTTTIDGTILYGVSPASSSGAHTITIKVGGAWAGPGAAVVFPFGLGASSLGVLTNTTGNYVRINAKNDQTYTMTAALPFATMGIAVLQGYTTNPGDLGKATFTTNLTSAANFTVVSGGSQSFADLIFVCTGTSNANHLFQTAINVTLLRCVFHGARGAGVIVTGASNTVFSFECEAYDCNKSNTANIGGFTQFGSGATVMCVNCYSHDHASGTNAHGYSSVTSPGSMYLVNCIADTCAGNGANWGTGSATQAQLLVLNSDFYNNVDGIKINATSAGNYAYIANCNFIKNSGKGINNTLTGQSGVIYNNGRGSGTQANGAVDALGSIVDTSTDVTYASNVTPWVAPTTGNFSINLVAANFAGRQAFTETDGTNTGTAGHPDIGSAQSLTGPGGTFSKEVSYGAGS